MSTEIIPFNYDGNNVQVIHDEKGGPYCYFPNCIETDDRDKEIARLKAELAATIKDRNELAEYAGKANRRAELAASPNHTVRLWVVVDGDKLTIFQQCPERLLNINARHTWDNAKRVEWPWEILGPEPRINGHHMTYADDPVEIEVSWRVIR